MIGTRYSLLIAGVVLAWTTAAQAQSLTDKEAKYQPPAATEPSTQPPPAAGPAALADPATLTIPQLLDEARAALDGGNVLLAKTMVQTALNRDEKNLDAMLIDAEIAMLEGDTDRARIRYQAVIRVQPNDFQANLGLGQLYQRSKVYRQSMFYLERAQSVAPADRMAELMTILAQAYRGAGYAKRALRAAQLAVQADPSYLEAWDYLVKLRTEAEDYSNALADSDRMLAVARQELAANPTSKEAVQRLYAAYSAQLGVLQSYQRTLYQPNPDGTVSDELQPGMRARAAETIRRVVDVMIVQAELLRTLAYFNMRDLTEKAVEYDPTNAKALMQYGLLLKNTAEYERARETFAKVLELDPQNDEARRQMATLPAAGSPPPSVTPAGSQPSASAETPPQQASTVTPK